MTNRHWKTTEDRSHKERVAMRQLLRDHGVIPPDAPNTKADAWLMNESNEEFRSLVKQIHSQAISNSLSLSTIKKLLATNVCEKLPKVGESYVTLDTLYVNQTQDQVERDQSANMAVSLIANLLLGTVRESQTQTDAIITYCLLVQRETIFRQIAAIQSGDF